jgi:hypothetical protein
MASDSDRTRRKRTVATRRRAQAARRRIRAVARPASGRDAPSGGEVVPLLDERQEHTETTPALTGGDVDADWQRAGSSGEEAVGGSVATPDQDVVDEIGEALGVAQDPEAEVTTSEEILRRRDRLRWHLELEADAKERQEEEQG